MTQANPSNVPIVPLEVDENSYRRILEKIVDTFEQRGLERESVELDLFDRSLFESETGNFFQVPGQFIFSICAIRVVVFVPIIDIDFRNFIQSYFV